VDVSGIGELERQGWRKVGEEIGPRREVCAGCNDVIGSGGAGHLDLITVRLWHRSASTPRARAGHTTLKDLVSLKCCELTAKEFVVGHLHLHRVRSVRQCHRQTPVEQAAGGIDGRGRWAD